MFEIVWVLEDYLYWFLGFRRSLFHPPPFYTFRNSDKVYRYSNTYNIVKINIHLLINNLYNFLMYTFNVHFPTFSMNLISLEVSRIFLFSGISFTLDAFYWFLVTYYRYYLFFTSTEKILIWMIFDSSFNFWKIIDS